MPKPTLLLTFYRAVEHRLTPTTSLSVSIGTTGLAVSDRHDILDSRYQVKSLFISKMLRHLHYQEAFLSFHPDHKVVADIATPLR